MLNVYLKNFLLHNCRTGTIHKGVFPNRETLATYNKKKEYEECMREILSNESFKKYFYDITFDVYYQTIHVNVYDDNNIIFIINTSVGYELMKFINKLKEKDLLKNDINYDIVFK